MTVSQPEASVWMVGGGIADILDDVLATTDVTTVMMPYASAVFSRRIPEDRPRVLPDRASNFAFLSQCTDLPQDVVSA